MSPENNSPTNHDCECPDRRRFLRTAGLLTGAGVAAPWALQLATAAPAAANTANGGYRALVCIFLYGGNDNWNTFIPNDTSGYGAYRAARPNLARDQSEILDISPAGGFPGAGSIGFARELTRTRELFSGGDAALVANVGTLLGPLNRSQYDRPTNRPPQLFSHNDQQSFWQSGGIEGAQSGWGGRIADSLLAGNSTTGSTSSGFDTSLFTSVSTFGNAIMMSGESAVQYQVSSRGVTTLRTDQLLSDSLKDGLRSVMDHPRNWLFPEAYADTTRRALVAADNLSEAITEANAGIDLSPFFADRPSQPAANLLGQLETVSRLILAGRNSLGLGRQVFFVGLGGFDTHSRLREDHPVLLDALDRGLSGFHQAMQAAGIDDEVTSFTASDFGRTLVSNTDGTDHGWGGHHLVVGGAVRGNRIVGALPAVEQDGETAVGGGRLLPTTSVDQYAATLGRWLGVPEDELTLVAPNLSAFSTTDLGLF